MCPEVSGVLECVKLEGICRRVKSLTGKGPRAKGRKEKARHKEKGGVCHAGASKAYMVQKLEEGDSGAEAVEQDISR